jgi:hypothetical protein
MNKRIILEVIGTSRHCSNDCPLMSYDAKYCYGFSEGLEWDKKRAHNGNRRLAECLQAELKAKKHESSTRDTQRRSKPSSVPVHPRLDPPNERKGGSARH